MDLRKLDTKESAAKGAILKLKGPDGSILKDEASGEPWTIELLGSDAEDYVKVQKRFSDKRLRGGIQKVANAPLNSDELEAEGIELLVTATKGWENLILDGKPLEYNNANARKLYTDFPFVREQVQEFINDRTNYLGN